MTINVFSGGTFADVFVAEGIWNEDQIDPSYDGSPARFIAEDGKIAQQGFASAEPYTYENVFEEWGKPIAYQTLHDAGFEVYSQTLSIVPGQARGAAAVPRGVRARRPAGGHRLHRRPGARPTPSSSTPSPSTTTFWTYDEGLAEYSVDTQRELGFIGNGPDDTLGNMDEARIQGVLDQIRDAGLEVPEDLEVTDLFTNEFVDPSIGLPN